MPGSGAVTVVTADLEGLAGYAVAAALRADRSLRVLASDVAEGELERAVAQRRPRVVIVDESVDYSLLVRLGSLQPATGVLVLVHRPSHLLGTSLLDVGAMCVARAASAADLVAAVHSAAEGEPGFYGAGDQATPPPVVADVLTKREAEVFVLLALGRSYMRIGRRLRIAPETVRTHTINICRKLHVKNKRELIGKSLSMRVEVSVDKSEPVG